MYPIKNDEGSHKSVEKTFNNHPVNTYKVRTAMERTKHRYDSLIATLVISAYRVLEPRHWMLWSANRGTDEAKRSTQHMLGCI